jgi:hypothetical protein
MNPTELDKQTLYFEVLTNREEGSPSILTRAVGLLSARSHYVTAVFPVDFLNSSRLESLVFEEDEIAQFVRNKSKQSFEIEGTYYTPHFIYIQPRSAISSSKSKRESETAALIAGRSAQGLC